MGELKLILYGSELGSVDLIAAEDIEVSPLLAVLDQISRMFQSFWFKFLFLFLLLFVVIFIISTIHQKQTQEKVSQSKPQTLSLAFDKKEHPYHGTDDLSCLQK